VKIRPRLARLENPLIDAMPKTLGAVVFETDDSSLFDLKGVLPAEPVGLGARAGSFVVGSRSDPGGFLRLTFEGEGRIRVESVAVVETRYLQKMGIDSVTWDGKSFVGIAAGSWFGDPTPQVFTIHDPVTLQVVDRKPAPPLVGAIAWDGKNWWAGSRKNTEGADEVARLYKLDSGFAIVEEFDPPGPGCQGLAWDGRRLYWADVFDDAIHVLAIENGVPRKIESAPSPVTYLSGLGFDGTNLWAVEYGGKTIRRVRRDRLASWGGGASEAAAVQGAPPVAAAPPSALPPSPADEARIALLRKQLRSEDEFAALRAEMELSRLGFGVEFDRYRAMGKPPWGSEETELVELTAELRGNQIFASWDIWVGDDLTRFAEEKKDKGFVSMPKFARYEVNVGGEGLQKKIGLEREAKGGHNIEKEVLLASGLRPGKYTVSVFIHVQYTTSEGYGKILNDNAGSCFLEVK
jgi:hypothetical protein